tara:strand:+ start:1402 stop:2154 length:753 start_codon:yes stop_codon:yes gene_type:complete
VFYIIAFVFGSIWGSFANVCIYRLPANKNVATGRSCCPNCNKLIKWYDNIPIISFLFLQGVCRNCSKKINTQYLLVELISGFSFAICYYFFGISITTLLFFILTICFVIIFFIDLKHFIIPNELTITLMVIGILKSIDPDLNNEIFPNFINSVLGGVIGYMLIWLIILFYKKVRNKEGMGLGDAKLLSAIGFWFGWVSLPFILFFSSFIALVSVLPDLIKNKKNLTSQIPFGPFIILGTVSYLFVKNYFI